jgi:hypothetical protein
MKVDRTYRACGFCAHFTTKDDPARADLGIGACHGFDGEVGPVEPFVHATARPCVQYHRSQQLAARVQFVARHQVAEVEAA